MGGKSVIVHPYTQKLTNVGDVSAESPNNGDLVTFDSTSGNWVSQAVPGATGIYTDTTNFQNNLGPGDNTVQKALETLDQMTTVGGSSVYTQLAHITANNEILSTNVTIDGDTYPYIIIEMAGSCFAYASEWVRCRFNSDTGNNYRYSDHFSGTSHSGSATLTTSYTQIGILGECGGISTCRYAIGSGRYRAYRSNCSYTASALAYNRDAGGAWYNTVDAVTTMTIYTTTAITADIYVYGRGA